MQQQQQGTPSMMPVMSSFPPANITTEQIQKYLDENKKLILAIMDNQNLGKLAECAQYQAQLQKNLMYLAAIADAQPQVATMPAQMSPHPAMQQGAYYMQQAQQAQQAAAAMAQQAQQPSPFPPRMPPHAQFSSPLQMHEQQQQQHQQQQQQQQQQPMPNQMNFRPTGPNNGMQAMQSETRGPNNKQEGNEGGNSAAAAAAATGEEQQK